MWPLVLEIKPTQLRRIAYLLFRTLISTNLLHVLLLSTVDQI